MDDVSAVRLKLTPSFLPASFGALQGRGRTGGLRVSFTKKHRDAELDPGTPREPCHDVPDR